MYLSLSETVFILYWTFDNWCFDNINDSVTITLKMTNYHSPITANKMWIWNTDPVMMTLYHLYTEWIHKS
jgi:hypothetical protein